MYQRARFDTENRSYREFDIRDYNRIPILRVNCSREMEQYLPYIAQRVLNAVFYPKSWNAARVYLYNQVGDRHFENNDYGRILEMTAAIAEKVLMLEGGNPERVIDRVAEDVVTFKCMLNFREDRGLAEMTPREIIQAADDQMADYARMIEDMDRSLDNSQRGGGGYDNRGGYGNRERTTQWGGSSSPSNRGWANSSRSDSGSNRSGSYGLYTTDASSAPSSSSGSNRGWGRRDDQDRPGWRDNSPTTTQTNNDIGSRLEVVNIKHESTLLGATPLPEEPKVEKIDLRPTEEIINRSYDWAQHPAINKRKEELANRIPEEILNSVELDEDLNWDSNGDNTLFAFDPNQLRVIMQEALNGQLKQSYARKQITEDKKVDIAQHLAAPEISNLDVEEVQTLDPEFAIHDLREPNTIVEETLEENPVVVEEINNRRTVGVCVYSSDAELIRAVEVERQIREVVYSRDPNKDRQKRPTASMLGYVCNVKAVAESDVSNIVDRITISSNSQEASGILKGQLEKAKTGEHIDTIKLIEFLNKRLTNRLNDFILKEMAYTSGDCTDYMNDVADVEKYIEENFGIGALRTLHENHGRIVCEALHYLVSKVGETAIDAVATKADMENLTRLKLRLIPFSEAKVVLSVSATCKELRIDLPTTKCAVVLRSDETPDFYRVVSDAQAVIDGLPSFGDQRLRLIVMTSDGRTFEINRGAFNKDAYMISVIA